MRRIRKDIRQAFEAGATRVSIVTEGGPRVAGRARRAIPGPGAGCFGFIETNRVIDRFSAEAQDIGIHNMPRGATATRPTARMLITRTCCPACLR